jgi:AGZA family xanthine/uracil permease-like MFS transporter
MSGVSWSLRRGDINGLLGVLLDNVAALALLYTLLAAPGYRVDRFAPSFVLTWLVPGTVTGVLVGGLAYAFLARRLMRRSGKEDVTAMPVGLDTPSVFAMSLFVLVPALAEGRRLFADRHLGELELRHLASIFAWHVSALVLLVQGVCKIVLAPFGRIVHRLLPRAALLGSMAAVALALIAFWPLARHIAPAPVIGLPVLGVVLVTLLGRRASSRGVPGSVLALGLGLLIAVTSIVLGEWRGWDFVPLPERSVLSPGPLASLPSEVWTFDWWDQVWWSALTKLPLALPFALITVVGGVECSESAAAAGDNYDTRSILFVEGLASAVGGALGGVVQTTPYFGHPAYKRMGAGWAYALLACMVLALMGYFGWFAHFFESVPGAALFPLIVYIGLRTIAHSLEVTPPRHYAAMAVAMVPVLAYLIVVAIDEIFAGRAPSPAGDVLLRALRCLGNGFILTSLLWAAALCAILDGALRRAALCLAVAAAFSLVGLMHSPSPGATLAWPHEVWKQLIANANPRVQFLSPFHWAAGYALAAGVVFIDSCFVGEAPKLPGAATPVT